MARLRIRIELNRGGVGVPLQKLASVVAESQQFFRMLGEDTHIDQQSGEWLGFDFDHESLNFTAEFVGPVTSEQVTAFYAAFDGTTSLRRATIAQFARITESIEGDELIGFGLYLSEVGAEPAEWRCLSRRDALRIAEEIRVLAGDDTVAAQSHLPAVTDSGMGARMFSERRERGMEPSRFAGMVREVEASLSKRIDRLDGEVAEHSGFITDLRSKTANSEQSIGRLVTAVEGFCEQATRRLETIPQQSQPALAAPSTDATPHHGFNWTPVATAAVFAALIGLGMLLWPSRSDGNNPQKAAASPGTLSRGPSNPAPLTPVEATPEPAKPAAAPTPQATPQATQAAKPAPPAQASANKDGVAHLEIEASEPSWVSIVEAGGNVVMSGLIEPGSTHDVNLSKSAVLRAGNAGGLNVRFNGTPVGPLGAHGAVREIEFSNGSFKLSPAK